MTAIEHYQGNGSGPSGALVSFDAGQSYGQVVDIYTRVVAEVAQTDFVPQSFRGKPAPILACMLYGREIGLQPMQSLRMIDSIQGTPTLKPEAMRALVRQAGHRIWFDRNDYNEQSVTIHGQRREDPDDLVVSATFTWQDGVRAGLTNKQTWRQYPRAMLAARATSELCRLHFADVIGGLSYTPEEAEEFGPGPVPDVGPVNATSPAPADPAPAPARRQPAPAPASRTQAEVIDAGVSEAKPATTRRRPPQQPQGSPFARLIRNMATQAHLTPADVQELVAAQGYTGDLEGIDEAAANKVIAVLRATINGASQETSEAEGERQPLSEDELPF